LQISSYYVINSLADLNLWQQLNFGDSIKGKFKRGFAPLLNNLPLPLEGKGIKGIG
jgi:hypothetical protein